MAARFGRFPPGISILDLPSFTTIHQTASIDAGLGEIVHSKETLIASLEMIRSLNLSPADLLADFSALRDSVKVDPRFLPKQAEPRAAAHVLIAGGIQRIDDLIRRLEES